MARLSTTSSHVQTATGWGPEALTTGANHSASQISDQDSASRPAFFGPRTTGERLNDYIFSRCEQLFSTRSNFSFTLPD